MSFRFRLSDVIDDGGGGARGRVERRILYDDTRARVHWRDGQGSH